MDNVNIPQGNDDRDLGLIDFMDEENLEQFIDLIRGENEEPMGAMFCQQSYGGCENISGYLADDNLFDYDNVGSYMLSSANVSGDVGNILPTGENDAGEVSSETTPEKKGTKADRSKTLVCERKRRGQRMRVRYQLAKFEAVGSLVPFLIKDLASRHHFHSLHVLSFNSFASTTAKIDLPLVAIADAADLDHPLAHRRLPSPQQVQLTTAGPNETAGFMDAPVKAPPARMLAPTMKPMAIAYHAAGGELEEEAGGGGAEELSDDVEDAAEEGDVTADEGAEGDGGVNVATGDVGSDGNGHEESEGVGNGGGDEAGGGARAVVSQLAEGHA
nr:transcription factor FER-LIKE IRON DEFICIENCY-INDUCED TRANSCRIPTION FACTOR-like [Ipomoea batatas]